ncbi:hypothetical protein B0H14DRAFT_2353867, partial [Mycena olivaceomarginata]
LPAPNSDLTGRTFLVTGSNTGLGLAAAVHLARLNPAHIVLGVRDIAKGKAARTLHVWELDMADFHSVKQFAAHARSLERLDGVFTERGCQCAWVGRKQ